MGKRYSKKSNLPNKTNGFGENFTKRNSSTMINCSRSIKIIFNSRGYITKGYNNE